MAAATQSHHQFAQSKAFWLIIQAGLITLAAYYLMSRALPDRMDADLIVGTMAGQHNLTLFFWGQDRLANLTALLTSPIREIGAALYFYSFFQALYFSGLIYLISRLIHTQRTVRLVSFALTILVAANWIPEREIFTFAKHAQPYAASTLFTLGAYGLPRVKQHPWGITLCRLGMLVTALLLNPLSGFLALTLPLSSLLCTRSGTRSFSINRILHWLAVLLAAGLVYQNIQATYRQQMRLNATPLALEPNLIPEGLSTAWDRLMDSYSEQEWALALLIVATLYALARWLWAIRRQDNNENINAIIGFAISLNTLSMLVIASSRWVESFGFPLRYFFPIYLLTLTATVQATGDLTRTLFDHSKRWPRQRQRVNTILATIGLTAVITILGLHGQALIPEITSYREIARAKPVFDFFAETTNPPPFVGGHFGLSWALYAYSIDQKKPIPTLSSRSDFDPMSAAQRVLLEQRIRRQEPFDYYCLQSKPHDLSACDKWLRQKLNDQSQGQNWMIRIHQVLHTQTQHKKTTTIHRLQTSPLPQT